MRCTQCIGCVSMSGPRGDIWGSRHMWCMRCPRCLRCMRCMPSMGPHVVNINPVTARDTLEQSLRIHNSPPIQLWRREMEPVTARDTIEQSRGATTRRYHYGKRMEAVTTRDTHEKSPGKSITWRFNYDKGMEPLTARNVLEQSLGGG